MPTWEEYKKKKEQNRIKSKREYLEREKQRQQAKANAEIQRRKVELSTKKESPNAFTKTNQMQQYNAPTTVVPNSIENRVNKMYEKIILKQEAEKDVIDQAKRMFENSKNIKSTLSEGKSSLINKPRADAKLGQEDLERLSEMDRKGRLDALKGRNEETFQEANLYALTKSNQQTEKKVNEAEGTKKILPTLEYLGKELGQNTVSSFGQIKATAEHIQGRDKNLKALENAQKYQEAISPLGENINSKFIKNLGIATEGLGQQMPQILLGSTGAGALVGGFTEFSNTYNEMTLENPNNKTKTMVTALLKGTVAGGLEHALGLFGGSKIDDLSKSQLAGIKNKLVRNAMATGYDVAGEITEEQLENIIGYVIDKAVNDKNITMEQVIKEAEATFKQTGLTTLLMSALGLGGNTRGEVNNLRDNLDIIEASNISGTEKKNLKEWVSSENVSNDQLYTQIGKMINENNISEQILEKTVENTQNRQATMQNKPVSEQEQQTTLPKYDLPQNQFSKVFEESAKKHQIDTNNDGVRIAKHFTDKANLQLEFEKLGKKTLAVYKNGRVIVNADAIKNNPEKVLQNIVLHEAIHGKSGSKELNDVMKTVLSFVKAKGEYKGARLDLDNIYAEAYKGRPDFEQLMDEEVVTNTLGEYFGTEEGLNELINYVDDRTTLQKIYDFVKDILNRVTGYKDQEQFFRRAERQLAKALQSDYVAKSGDRYFIQTVAEFNENEYNNARRILLGKTEFKALSDIINSDSNIRAGINLVETTNATYTVYFKETGEFKVLSVERDLDAGELSERNDTARGTSRYSLSSEPNIKNTIPTTSNDEISNINTKGTGKRSRSNTSGTENIRNEGLEESSSFNLPKLEDRVSGDDLLDAQDFIEEVKSVGAEVDENGYVTVYHQTTTENAKKIKESGKMSAKEDGIFFSTSKNAQQSEGRGTEKIKFKIPAEILQLDDIFDDNADVRIPLKSKNEVIDVSQYIVKDNDVKQQQVEDTNKYSLSQDTRKNIESKIDRYSRIVEEMQQEGRDSDEWTPYANEILRLQDQLEESRYSYQTNGKWQEFVEKYFSSEGTKTKLGDIRLPEKNVLQENVAENLSKVTTEEFQRYKRKIIEGKQKEINNLIQIKNQTLTEIQNKIDIKEAQLNNFKNPNSITAQKIKAQIETLKERYNRTENEYLQRIDRRNQRVTRALIEAETKRALKRTRKQVQKALLEQAKIEEVNLDDAKNISTLNMNRTDPIRLQEKVFGKEVGDKINEMFFNKVKHNTAEKTRFLNRERDSIKKWDIKPRSKESEILQKYTEKSFVNAEGKEIEYTDSDLIKDIQDEKTRNKIIKASQELRAKYDNYIDTANDILVDLGYSPIPKRKDYVRHFTELNDIFSKYGVPGKLNDSLPTDINGLTEGFRPGKNFFANAQKRLGNKTTYDAITGIDGYLEGISNLIYHTEDIQRLRAFDKFIRDTYGQNGLENFDKLSDTEKNKRIELISNNHLSEYAKWLTEYTNNLAGKNSVFDRSVEGFLGRKVYSALNAIKKQTGSNMTGFNLGSALTNFVSVAQGASKTKKIALFKGLVSSIQNIAVKDDFIERSDFLTNRFGSDSISKKAWDKASNAGQVFMSATDYLSSNIVVRSKYYEQIAKGKTEEEAMKIADDFGARILGDRSQGAVANIFNSKMLGIVTQFQLEVNNQFDTFIHDTKLDYQETTQKEGALKASMGAVWTLGQLAVYQHIFNELFEKINGNRPAFDVIEIVKTALGIDDEEDEDDDIKGNLQEAVVMLVESVPFINLFSENARIPIASAVPNILSIATGESTLKKEASKLLYLLPPTGGGQLKKSAEGIKTVVDGGSYFINSKGEKELRFPVENVGAKDYLKAGVFGKYSLPLAKEYVDKDYKRLSAKATELYDNSTIEFKKLNEFLDYSKQKEIKKKDKISYINNMDLTTDQKWDLYKYDVISDTERKDGTSQLSDAEYILKNNMATKSEYMKLYAEAEKNNVEFPATETLKELKEADLELGTYMKYKTALTIANREKKAKAEEQEKSMLPIKEEDKLSKSLNEDEMIDLIKDYSIGDKKKIYENYIGKDDELYKNLKLLTKDRVKIEDYLEYKTSDFSNVDDPNSNIKGKTISGTGRKLLKNFLNNSNFSGIEQLYITGTKRKLENDEKQALVSYVNSLGLTDYEEKQIYKKLQGYQEREDGAYRLK